MRKRLIHVLGMAVASAAVWNASAATLTTSGSAPASAAISQPDFSGPAFNGAQDFTDNAGPPGQTFTATAGTTAFNAITLKGFANTGASFGGAVNVGSWTITVSRVDAGNVLTRLAQETGDPAAVTDGSAYVTIALASPVTLTPGTKYAFDVFSSQGYFGFAKSTTDVYADGEAFQHGTTSRAAADGATLANLQGVDRTFFVNPNVPEPASLGLVALAGGALLARRRRS